MTAGDPPPRLQGASWLTRGVLAKVLSVLDAEGHEARVVGGTVRNAILGEPLGDFDVATTAPPEEAMTRLRRAGFKVVPTGVEHGTVTVVAGERVIEITTLREDVETFGRHAVVRFGRDWRADAERRDFTMNALSVSRDGALHDYLGGLVDLEARRVRFIGNAEARIREDYLRILRFFRFHAAYGQGSPDPDGVAATIAMREGLRSLSRERIRTEVLKLLVAGRAEPVLVAMAEAGLLGIILAGVPLTARFARLAGLEAALGCAPDPILRLGALAMHVGDDAERLRERLRLSNAEHERLRSMGARWWEVDASDAGAGRALLYRLGPARFRERILYAWAATGAGPDDPAWRALAELPQSWSAPRFPIEAADLIGRGINPGPALGAALREAEEAWIAAGFPDDFAAVARIAEIAASAAKA